MLNLLRRSTSEEKIPEPQPQLLQPREALTQHLAERSRLLAKALGLQAISDAARTAEEKEHEAQSTLDRIAEDETEALGRWSSDPTQPPPSFIEERAKAGAVLVPLRAEATAARHRAEALTPTMVAAIKEYTTVASQTSQFVRAVVFEQADSLAEQFIRLQFEAQAHEAMLRGLQDVFRLKEDGEASARIQSLFTATHEQREQIARISKVHREKGRKFVNTLADDASATLEADLG